MTKTLVQRLSRTTSRSKSTATMTATATTTLTMAPLRVLIINPNTTTAMTTALEPAVSSVLFPSSSFDITYFTCPPTGPGGDGIPSINSPADAALSASACIPFLGPDVLEKHDVFLVACYSAHPLVSWLRSNLSGRGYVTGIFEASVAASLALVGPHGDRAAFGIVSTGSVWGPALGEAVHEFLGFEAEQKSPRFLGCETTGLNADELHRLDPAKVRERMKAATKKVVRTAAGSGRSVRAVCLGCAGMVGLDEAVREALVEELGVDEARMVAVVDGVKAGAGELVMLARGRF